jgi:hypothetical protein
MKRIALFLCMAAWSAPGCMFNFTNQEKPPQVEMKQPVLPPSVTADSVTEQNAADRARALREELEHDMKMKAQSP